ASGRGGAADAAAPAGLAMTAKPGPPALAAALGPITLGALPAVLGATTSRLRSVSRGSMRGSLRTCRTTGLGFGLSLTTGNPLALDAAALAVAPSASGCETDINAIVPATPKAARVEMFMGRSVATDPCCEQVACPSRRKICAALRPSGNSPRKCLRWIGGAVRGPSPSINFNPDEPS